MRFTGLRPRRTVPRRPRATVEVLPAASAPAVNPTVNVTVNVTPERSQTITTDAAAQDASARAAIVELADELDGLKQRLLAQVEAGTMIADEVDRVRREAVKRTELIAATEGLHVLTPKDTA